MSREYKRETWESIRYRDRDRDRVTHERRAQVNTSTNRKEVVTEHAHTYRNTCDTLTRFVVQKEIVGSGRFRDCWLVPKNREREAQIFAFPCVVL